MRSGRKLCDVFENPCEIRYRGKSCAFGYLGYAVVGGDKALCGTVCTDYVEVVDKGERGDTLEYPAEIFSIHLEGFGGIFKSYILR